MSDDSEKKRARWSFPREILLCRDKVGPFAIGPGRKCYEFLVVAPGLRSMSGSFSGLRGACKRAIAVRIVAQRRLEFTQGLRRLIRIEQQLAKQFPDRREAIFHRDSLAASIF